MSMHLHHPSLSLNGKRKGKIKFRNAEEARKSRELDADWTKLKSKWAVPEKEKKVGKTFEPYRSTLSPHIRDTGPRIPSLNGGKDTSPAVKAPEKVYTGTKVLGIATMHKSNAVPVFAAEDAIEISKMRRG
jgi:hypothetical protein